MPGSQTILTPSLFIAIKLSVPYEYGLYICFMFRSNYLSIAALWGRTGHTPQPAFTCSKLIRTRCERYSIVSKKDTRTIYS